MHFLTPSHWRPGTLGPLVLCAALAAGGPIFRNVAANEPRPDAPHIAQLVRQLGSVKFAERERASRELTALGIVAKDALTAAIDDPDAELRNRARDVLAIVTDADFAARLNAFEADYDGRRGLTLPGWEMFAERFGGHPPNRRLFAEMARHEPHLLEAYAERPETVADVLDARCADLLEQYVQVAGLKPEFPVGTIATLLLIGSDDGVTVDEQFASQLFTWMIYQSSFKEPARSGPWSASMKKLLGNWVARDVSPSVTMQNLILAASYELHPQGLALAKKVLDSEPATPRLHEFALMAIGRFGDRQELPLVEKFLDDATVCGAVHLRKPPRQIELQLRDVALAVAVHLTSQDAESYGSADVQSSPQTFFQIPTLAFTTESKRSAALTRWSEWRSKYPDDDQPAVP